MVAGLHNYYRLATHISVDFPKLSYGLKLQMTNRLRELTPKGKLGVSSYPYQNAALYTRPKEVMRKLDTLVVGFPDTYKLTEQNKLSKTYSFPKSYVIYRKPRKLSEEQR